MKKTNVHQYCYWIRQGAAMCAVGAGVLFPAISAHAAGDAINPVILLADAPLPASGAEGLGAFGAPVAADSPAASIPSKTDSESDSVTLASDVSNVFAPNDCISRTGSACFRGNGGSGGHGGLGSSSGSDGSNGGGAGGATASTGGLAAAAALAWEGRDRAAREAVPATPAAAKAVVGKAAAVTTAGATAVGVTRVAATAAVAIT
ncbi:hypothetical protein M3I53_11005, partial [Paraburkholderia sp. CNPSo 3272]|nr:hypothetical protein [Paraburkholderia sp. CNPSo 3272]